MYSYPCVCYPSDLAGWPNPEASLSKPHTRELGGEMSVAFVCPFVRCHVRHLCINRFVAMYVSVEYSVLGLAIKRYRIRYLLGTFFSLSSVANRRSPVQILLGAIGAFFSCFFFYFVAM